MQAKQDHQNGLMLTTFFDWAPHLESDLAIKTIARTAMLTGRNRVRRGSTSKASMTTPEGRKVEVFGQMRNDSWFVYARCGVRTSPVLGPTQDRESAALKAAQMASGERLLT